MYPAGQVALSGACRGYIGAFGKDRVLALGCLCLRSKEGNSQALELQHPPLHLLIEHIPWSGEEGPWALGPDPLTAE